MAFPLTLLPSELQLCVLENLRVLDILNLRLAGRDGHNFVDLLHIQKLILEAIRTHQRVDFCSLLGLIFPDGQSHCDFVARCRQFADRVRAQDTNLLGLIELTFVLAGERMTRLRPTRTGALIGACGLHTEGRALDTIVGALLEGMCAGDRRETLTGLDGGMIQTKMYGLLPVSTVRAFGYAVAHHEIRPSGWIFKERPYDFGCAFRANAPRSTDAALTERWWQLNLREFRKHMDGTTFLALRGGFKLTRSLAKSMPHAILFWMLDLGKGGIDRAGHLFTLDETAELVRSALLNQHRKSRLAMKIIQATVHASEDSMRDVFSTLTGVPQRVWGDSSCGRLLQDELVTLTGRENSTATRLSGARTILYRIFTVTVPKMTRYIECRDFSLSPEEKWAKEDSLALEDLKRRQNQFLPAFRQEATRVGFSQHDITWVLAPLQSPIASTPT